MCHTTGTGGAAPSVKAKRNKLLQQRSARATLLFFSYSLFWISSIFGLVWICDILQSLRADLFCEERWKAGDHSSN